MAKYTQANRPIAVTTPLGPDVLLVTSVKGHEGISELYRFELGLLAELGTPVPFEAILGQGVTVEMDLPDGSKRFLDGIVSRFEQGKRDEFFTYFRAELVPRLWLLTRKVRSRIFQHLTVPEILAIVLGDITVKSDLTGWYEPRDYCTQYRESDFAFASRLMEEEGISYYFEHSMGSHVVVLTDDANHPDLTVSSAARYEQLEGRPEIGEMRVSSWVKSQEVRSDAYTLRDHCFEMPRQSLEAQQPILDSVPVGTVNHKLKVTGEPLEVYDFPGGYAQRYDGIDGLGSERPDQLQKIFWDMDRTVRLRMEIEEMLSVRVDGIGSCRDFTPGFAFTLTEHFDADGRYLITRVEHEALLDGDYRSGGELPFKYHNRFRCMPAALPYRPERLTPRPAIVGSQTATVVAPPGEEIFCDKYGRVRVQFHWDREGSSEVGSQGAFLGHGGSCWIRVAQPWAGKGWGAFFWPRAGHEVVVSFEEGDPDQPLIIGSVYNAENMPPFTLPSRNRVAGFKSASVRGTARKHYNGVVFYDEKGAEHLSIHSERTLDFNTEWDKEFHAGRNQHEMVSSVSASRIGCLPGGGGGGGGLDEATVDPGPAPTSDTSSSSASGDGASTTGDGATTTGDGATTTGEGATTTGEGGSTTGESGTGAGEIGGEEYKPFERGAELGALGLDSKLVVGEALLAVAGLNELIFLGSNIQMQINPAALNQVGGAPPVWLEAMAGGGYGGNLVFTVGTNSLVTLGRNIIISDSEDLKYEMGSHIASKILCVLISIVTIVWAIVYGVVKKLEDRLILFAVFQPSLSILFATLLIVEGEYDLHERNEKYLLINKVFKALDYNATLSPIGWKHSVKGDLIGIAKSAASLALPIVLGAGLGVSETHRDEGGSGEGGGSGSGSGSEGSGTGSGTGSSTTPTSAADTRT